MKVVAIEEAQNISSMKVNELIGSLTTYEFVVDERGEKKSKSIALVTNAEDNNELEDESDESISEAMVLLGKQFNRIASRLNGRPKSFGKNSKSSANRGNENQSKQRAEERDGQSKGIRCFECEGYGHVKTECATYLKKQNKSLTASWSDEEEPEEDEETETAKKITALTSTCVTDDEDSCDEEELLEELQKQKRISAQLQTERYNTVAKIDYLQKEVNCLSFDLKEANNERENLNIEIRRLKKYSNFMEKGHKEPKESLNQLQERPQQKRFNYKKVNQYKDYSADLMYTQPKETLKTVRQMLQHPQQHPAPRYGRRFRSWVCHHCGRKGHIRPFCYKLYGYPERKLQSKPMSAVTSTHKEWKPKAERVKEREDKASESGDTNKRDVKDVEDQEIGLIARTPLNNFFKEEWYFDSECSRHMTGTSKILVGVTTYPTSFVTFGDGGKGEIVGIGNLTNGDLPKLENVLLVKDLTANLISISQLCDQGMKINFTKTECQVTDDKGNLLMRGVKSKGNCYLWVSQEETNQSSGLKTKENEENYEVSQTGKQIKMTHLMLQHSKTISVIELDHKTLTKTMQVESINRMKAESTDRKRRVYNSSSRYDLINLIKDKFERTMMVNMLCTQLQKQKVNVTLRIRGTNGKGRTLLKLTEVKPHVKNLSYNVCSETLKIGCCMQSRATLRSGNATALFKSWINNKSIDKYAHDHGSRVNRICKVHEFNTKDAMESARTLVSNSENEDRKDAADDAPASHMLNDTSETTKRVRPVAEISCSEQLYALKFSIRVLTNHSLRQTTYPKQSIVSNTSNEEVSKIQLVCISEQTSVKNHSTTENGIKGFQEGVRQGMNSICDLVSRTENIFGIMVIYKSKSTETMTNGGITYWNGKDLFLEEEEIMVMITQGCGDDLNLVEVSHKWIQDYLQQLHPRGKLGLTLKMPNAETNVNYYPTLQNHHVHTKEDLNQEKQLFNNNPLLRKPSRIVFNYFRS
ncbi:gag-protease polyprotein [Trifolium medium]|uniref:Gag-protease polyprotein n=1 Tax=Trifolium medium TaxID=97028 RepID=A0A392LY46_9FABA|nr:gag-protease polyprotein [Trifolium medium]